MIEWLKQEKPEVIELMKERTAPGFGKLEKDYDVFQKKRVR